MKLLRLIWAPADARALADAVARHPAGRKRGERVAPVIDIRTREVIE